jgi:hypothetical protein
MTDAASFIIGAITGGMVILAVAVVMAEGKR